MRHVVGNPVLVYPRRFNVAQKEWCKVVVISLLSLTSYCGDDWRQTIKEQARGFITRRGIAGRKPHSLPLAQQCLMHHRDAEPFIEELIARELGSLFMIGKEPRRVL